MAAPVTTPSRRQLLALSAALAGTTLTAAAAIAGLARHQTAPVQLAPTVVQQPTSPGPGPEAVEPGG